MGAQRARASNHRPHAVAQPGEQPIPSSFRTGPGSGLRRAISMRARGHEPFACSARTSLDCSRSSRTITPAARRPKNVSPHRGGIAPKRARAACPFRQGGRTIVQKPAFTPRRKPVPATPNAWCARTCSRRISRERKARCARRWRRVPPLLTLRRQHPTHHSIARASALTRPPRAQQHGKVNAVHQPVATDISKWLEGAPVCKHDRQVGGIHLPVVKEVFRT